MNVYLVSNRTLKMEPYLRVGIENRVKGPKNKKSLVKYLETNFNETHGAEILKLSNDLGFLNHIV